MSDNISVNQSVADTPAAGEVKKERGNITFPLNPRSKPLSVGSYILMFLVSIISPINIIFLLIWAFSPNSNINRRNYARAALIILLVLIIILSVAMFIFNKEIYDYIKEIKL